MKAAVLHQYDESLSSGAFVRYEDEREKHRR